MKAQKIVFFVFLVSYLGYSQVINFPDPNFRDYLLNNYSINRNGDDVIDASEARSYMGAINCNGKNISDLAGIEYFIQITGLYCDNNTIEVLDLSNLTRLEGLFARNNNLKILDLTNREIFLRRMDVTGNPNLTCIKIDKDSKPYWEWKTDSIAKFNYYCDSYPELVNIPDANFKSFLVNTIDENNDGEIQLSEAEKTFALDCSNQDIKDLTGIEAFKYLETLNCSSNELTLLKLNDNKFLKQLKCNNNQLSTLIADKIDLDLLECSNNIFEEINLESFTSLKTLNCSSNKLKTLSLQNNTNLVDLNCNLNNITALNLIRNNVLEKILCKENQLEILDMGNKSNALIQEFDATNNNLNCITIDSNFTPPSNWKKDINTNFSDSCFNADAIINIPDPNFKQYLISNTNINLNGDEHIQMAEAVGFNGDLNCTGKRITSLSGIEYFTNIVSLNCSWNGIKDVYLEKNKSLTYLDVSYNSIEKIDLSVLSNLKTLYCTNNALKNLDVKANKELTYLNCNYNVIEELDLSGNLFLAEFNAHYNSLKSLDVSKNKNLKILRCNTNNLTSLNLANTNNEALMVLDVRYNWYLNCINIDEGFDPSANSSRDWKKEDKYANYSDDCYGTKIINIPDENFKQCLLSNPTINTNGDEEIQTAEVRSFDGVVDCSGKNIQSLKGLEHIPNLTSLYCQDNQITTIDLTSNTKLINVNCGNNNLSSINLSSNPNLLGLYCGGNNLTELNLEATPSLLALHCHYNAINSLDVSNLSNLKEIYAFKNELSSLNVATTNNGSIVAFNVSNNPSLTCIKIDEEFTPNSNWVKDEAAFYNSNCDKEPTLEIPDANFKSYLINNLDINKNSDAEIQVSEAASFYGVIDCSNKNISSLIGIQEFINISSLYCYNNSLDSLDISKNKFLFNLNCRGNNLKALNVSSNEYLAGLYCGFNQLDSLDVSSNTNLQQLNCHYNNISELDISKNEELNMLNAFNNKLTKLNVANSNNSSIAVLNVINNENLSCIKIDENFTPNMSWKKDSITNYSSNCSNYELLDVSSLSENVKNDIRVIPNPASKLITINSKYSIQNISVYNAMGHRVTESSLQKIDVSYLLPGVYVAKIYTVSNGVITKQFIKK